MTPQPKVFAESSSTGCEAELYKLSNIADTQTLTATDIIDGSDVEQIGNNQQQMLSTNSPYKSSATKDVARYWQMRVNNSDLPINASDVKYTLSPSDEANNPFKENKVELRVLDIEKIDCSDEEATSIITGGISLEFRELSNLVSGTFLGQINVCVQVSGNLCD
ncbi:hypothetical protein [Calothrix sp. CCY 0018]|uniref:hypothetical protein n=1 Tax=Calothrix sp. CCY 0018 TaxID=3103864 RepID=UPI0039C653A9